MPLFFKVLLKWCVKDLEFCLVACDVQQDWISIQLNKSKNIVMKGGDSIRWLNLKKINKLSNWNKIGKKAQTICYFFPTRHTNVFLLSLPRIDCFFYTLLNFSNLPSKLLFLFFFVQQRTPCVFDRSLITSGATFRWTYGFSNISVWHCQFFHSSPIYVDGNN